MRLFSRVLDRLRAALEHEELIPSFDIGLPEKYSFYETAFHDDVGLPIVAPAAKLVQACTSAASNAVVIFGTFGLQLNLEVGKSACMPIFYGDGALRARAKLEKMSNCIPLRWPGSAVLKLLFVNIYKHMGTVLALEHDAKNEAAIRAAYIRHAHKVFQKVLSDPAIDLRRKIALLQSYFLAGGFFSAPHGLNYRSLHTNEFMRLYLAPIVPSPKIIF